MSLQIGAKRQSYSPDMLEHAAGLVRAKSISLNQAAKKYGVPKTTLQNAVHYKYSGHKVGHKTVLSEQEEQRIADWAIHMARIGYGRTRQELANTVKRIIDLDGRETPFRENRPGKEWLNRFFSRHPDLSLRTTIQLGKERAIISAEKIAKWFADFQTYIVEEVGDKELLTDPTRIYNADETGVSLCMKGSQVIGFKGAPVVYHYGNSDKTQLTVMAACSAAAHFVPPMIIFPGQRFSYNPLEGFEEAALGRSDNGWMDSEVFCRWLENVFIPAVNERNVKKPVLLLIDGHVTHVTMKASDICLENGIEMYCLLEHASHVLQPLDLRLFSSLKKTWRQAVRDWQSEHIGEYVTKVTFARVFKNAWVKSTTVDVAVKGFKEAGLFPLDPTVVTKSVKIEPSKMFNNDTPVTPTTSNISLENLTTSKQPDADSRNHDDTHRDSEKQSEPQSREEESLMTENVPNQQTNDDAKKNDEDNKQTNEGKQAKDEDNKQQTSEGKQAKDDDNKQTNEGEQAKDEDNKQTNEGKQAKDDAKNTGESIENQGEKPKNDTTQQNINTAASPFSKYLTIPTPKIPSKSKVIRRITIPKAITGTAYRKLMEEKRAKKEEEELAKEKRKTERLQKRKVKEEEKIKKKAEMDTKRRKKAEEKQLKRKLHEKLLKSLEESGSESDDAAPIDRANCYACELPYSTDYIECATCLRRFHIECVVDEYMQVEGLPFECKFC